MSDTVPNPDEFAHVQAMTDDELMTELEEAVEAGAEVRRNDDPDRLIVVTTRLPQRTIDQLKQRAGAAGVPYQRLLREILEAGLRGAEPVTVSGGRITVHVDRKAVRASESIEIVF